MTPEETRRLSDRTWQTFNAGDLDGWLDLVDPQFDGHSALVEAEGGASFTGIEGARAWWTNLRETFETVEVTLEQVLAVGEHSIAVASVRWVGKGSGVELQQPVFFAGQARDNRWLYVHSHLDPAAAFSDVADRLRQGASSPSQ